MVKHLPSKHGPLVQNLATTKIKLYNYKTTSVSEYLSIKLYRPKKGNGQIVYNLNGMISLLIFLNCCITRAEVRLFAEKT